MKLLNFNWLKSLNIAGSRHITVDPPSCLERGVNYTIRIEFTRYRSDEETPDATVLIDSVSYQCN